jgi:hypothetical protein
MIRRGEGGWADVGRALMVARWWGCERVPTRVSTGNRTRATIKALERYPVSFLPFPTPPPSPLRMLMSFLFD